MKSSFATLFREDAVTVEALASVVDEQLLPEEWAYIRNAVPQRRAEFGTARVCARRALVAMGLPPVALVPGAGGAPIWPEGVVGSISHSDGQCAVVLDRSPPVRSVGLDIEKLRPLDAGMLDLILTPRERAWLLAEDPDSREDLAMLIFSAKEAYYKCQHPISGRLLEFHDVELAIDRAAGRFDARCLQVGLPASVTHLRGRFLFASNIVTCGVTLLA